MQILLTLLLATAACLLHPAPAESRDLFVSRTGDDSTGVSWESAYLSIGRALSEADPGDAVHVAAGVYIESVTIPVGVSLFGGHPPHSSGSILYNRNPRIYTTTIGGTDKFSIIWLGHGSMLDGFSVFGRILLDEERTQPAPKTIRIRTCRIVYEDPRLTHPAIHGSFPFSDYEFYMEECFLKYTTENPSPFLVTTGRNCRIVNTIFSYDLPLESPPILLAGLTFRFANCVIYDRGGDRIRPGGSFESVGQLDSFAMYNTISNQGIGVTINSPLAVFISRSIWPFASNTLPGQNNRAVDPQFIDPENDDFRVHPTSPAIDMGQPIPSYFGPVRHDFGGRPRVVDIPGVGGTLEFTPPAATALYAIDIGAYEMQLDEYRLRSDLNGDGGVDALDLLIFSQDWHEGTGP